MILFDILEVDYLREKGILLKISKEIDDDEKLAIVVSELYKEDERLIYPLSFLLLRMCSMHSVDSNGQSKPNLEVKNLLFNLDDSRLDILKNILKHIFSLVVDSSNTDMIKRISTIYNSVSEEYRRILDTIETMFNGVSVDKKLFMEAKYRKPKNINTFKMKLMNHIVTKAELISKLNNNQSIQCFIYY